MGTACACAMALMLVFVNGEQRRPIEFNTRDSCNRSKNEVLMQYPASERRNVRLTCINK